MAEESQGPEILDKHSSKADNKRDVAHKWPTTMPSRSEIQSPPMARESAMSAKGR